MRTLIARGSFAEHVEIDGFLYGTSHTSIKAVARSGRSCALSISVSGALQLRDSSEPAFSRAKFVFIAPESMPQLEEKLRTYAMLFL